MVEEVRPPPDAPPPVSTPPLLPAPAAAPIGARRGHHGTRARHWSGWLVARPSNLVTLPRPRLGFI